MEKKIINMVVLIEWVFLLTNLGTPDEPTAKAVKPYLKEFLSDPRVIEIPKFLWQIILRGIILQTRPRKSAKTLFFYMDKRWVPTLGQ